MAGTRFATDRGLIARMGVTMFLIGLVFTAFVVVVVLLLLSYSNVSDGGIIFIAALLGIGISFGSYYWSDRIALATAGGQLVSPEPGAGAAWRRGPAVRACRHAQAEGRDRAGRHAERLRDRAQQQGRRRLRHRGPAAQAGHRASLKACLRTRCRTWRTRTWRS